MAIADLVPVFDRVRRPNLKLITQNITADRLHPRKFIMIVGIVFSVCLLLKSLISIWTTSDAFILQDLKHERNLVQDQKDALLSKVNQFSSPDLLAASALKLGMMPAENIQYLDMSQK
mgnify:CR=1 FL=1